jgi:hypothetical protein
MRLTLAQGHLENIERLMTNSDLISDIEIAVNEIIELIKKDTNHFNAPLESETAIN